MFWEQLIRSIIAVLFIAFFQMLFPNATYYHYLAILFLLLIFYRYILPIIRNLKSKFNKYYRRFRPKIGILDGNIFGAIKESKCKRIWTEITPSMWYSALKSALQDISIKRIELIPVTKIDDTYSMIINPFGDNFPEEDTKLHTSFYKVCNYINQGGYFVVTGGAFFWNQNSAKSQDEELFITKIVNNSQSLLDSPLYFEFGIITTGGSDEPKDIKIYQDDKDKNILGDLINDNTGPIERFRAISKSTSEYIPLVRQVGGESIPLAAVPYGDGCLLHSGVYLKNESCPGFTILMKAIKVIIQKRFKLI